MPGDRRAYRPRQARSMGSPARCRWRISSGPYALELARRNITVNAVCPGYTDTDLSREAIASIQAKTGRSEADVRAIFTAHNPQGRMVSPQEVAQTVLWLCTNDVPSITGQSIAVAGGELM